MFYLHLSLRSWRKSAWGFKLDFTISGNWSTKLETEISQWSRFFAGKINHQWCPLACTANINQTWKVEMKQFVVVGDTPEKSKLCELPSSSNCRYQQQNWNIISSENQIIFKNQYQTTELLKKRFATWVMNNSDQNCFSILETVSTSTATMAEKSSWLCTL